MPAASIACPNALFRNRKKVSYLPTFYSLWAKTANYITPEIDKKAMVGSHPFHISEPYPNSSSISISAGTLVRPTAQSSSPHPVAIISA